MDSFQQFKNRAKEKADRQKMLEQAEMKQRSHKEAVEKRQQEQQKKREEIDRYSGNHTISIWAKISEKMSPAFAI